MTTKIHTDMMRLLKQMENPYLRHIDLGLGRMAQLMAMLGRPDRKLPPVIHVAGTNGKGSLMAYLRAMLEADGKAVHVYTSPHLIRFNERVVLAGKEVEDKILFDALLRVHRMREQFPSTLFEGVTAAAFTLFVQHKADALLLEVGMGGRLDATNIIEKPVLTAITPVSMDHAEFLGKDVAAIAGEKAGIIKSGVPCVVGPQVPEAMEEITAQAQKLKAPLFRCGYEWHIERDGYSSGNRRLTIPKPSLAGSHQYHNAATAIACVDVLNQYCNIKLPDNVITAGIQTAQWPGRLQQLHSNHWLQHLPEGSEVWLDGGHNPAAGEILADWLRGQGGKTAGLHLICGMMKRKDALQFLKVAGREATQVWTVPIPDESDAFSPQELAAVAAQAGVVAQPVDHPSEALRQIGGKAAGKPVKALIAGSLYLAGTILAEGL